MSNSNLNYIVKSESALFYECGYSCDNGLFLRVGAGGGASGESFSRGAGGENGGGANGGNPANCANPASGANGGAAFFITDGRYASEARECVRAGVEVVQSSEIFAAAATLAHKCAVRTLTLDSREFTLFEFDALQKAAAAPIKFEFAPNFSQKKRIVKSPHEIALLRAAAQAGKAAFARLAGELREGMSEAEINFLAREILLARGAFGLSFEPITALNANAAKAHALPSSARLAAGDLLLFDGGVRRERYCSDLTRTAVFGEGFSFDKEQDFCAWGGRARGFAGGANSNLAGAASGKPPATKRPDHAKMQEIYDIVKEAQAAAIAAVVPGALACQVDAAARQVIARAGYGEHFIHSTGHGVGLDIHELPVINARSQTPLQEGMVFSVEPGIYLEGEFGVRIEDVVVVTKSGCEVL